MIASSQCLVSNVRRMMLTACRYSCDAAWTASQASAGICTSMQVINFKKTGCSDSLPVMLQKSSEASQHACMHACWVFEKASFV